MEWFEQVERYVHLEPEQFTYSLLTGSQRIGHENLKLRDAGYVESVERWFAARSGVSHAVPPMFTPYTVRGLDAQESRDRLADGDVHGARRRCPTIFIWFIWARAPWAAPRWW